MEAIKTKVFNETFSEKPNQSGGNVTKSTNCQVIGPKTDLKDLTQIVDYWKKKYPSVETYGLINRMMNSFSKSYESKGIPKRVACEVALMQIRPEYNDKNAIIVDTLSKLLYIYDKAGKFITKTEILSGKDKQSTDPKKIATSLLTWEERANKLGFKWVDKKGYVDSTGKNRKYDSNLVYDDISKTKTGFLPKGIYTTGSKLDSDEQYAGKANNLLRLFDGNKPIVQAIHGYYIEQPRTIALQKAKEVISNPNDPKVSKEFMDLVVSGGVNLSQSSGCINVPENFIPYLRKYSQNSYVFNMGEDEQNYLVQNTENYFDKMTNSESCPSPSSLGAIPVSDFAVA